MNDLTPVYAIGCEINASPDGLSGEWRFEYKEADSNISLRFSMNDKSLVSELDKESIDGVIQWLQKIRHSMPD